MTSPTTRRRHCSRPPLRALLSVVVLTATGCRTEAPGPTAGSAASPPSPASAAATGAPSVAPSASAAPPLAKRFGPRALAPLAVPPPTKEPRGAIDMRYFEWSPPAPLARNADDTDDSLAARVLASEQIMKLLGGRSGVDAFAFNASKPNPKEPTKVMFTFTQTTRWQHQFVQAYEKYATVELTGGALSYVGSGFLPGIEVPDKPVEVNEKKAGDLALADWESRNKPAKGRITPHKNPGLFSHRAHGSVVVPWKGDTLGYFIHVEGEDHRGDSELILIDAFSGATLKRHKSAIH